MLETSLFVISIILFFVCLYSLLIKDFLNPLVLFILPLFLQFTIFYFLYSELYSISIKTVIAFFTGIASFVIGYLLYSLVFKNSNSNIKRSSKKKVNIRTNWLFVIPILLLGIISIYFSRRYLNTLGHSSNIFDKSSANLREAFIENKSDTPFYVTYGKYFLLFPTLVIWYDFLKKNIKIPSILMLSLIGLVFYNSFNVFSRTDLFISIIPFVIIFFNIKIKKAKNSKFERRKFRTQTIWLLSGIIMLIFLMNSMRSIETSKNTFFSPKNVTMQYIGRPIAAFDQWIIPNSGVDGRFIILEPVEKLLNFLRSQPPKLPSLAPYGQFNVYSYLKAPYLMFGITGVMIIMILVGFFCHFLYHQYKQGDEFWVIFYSVYAYAIGMAFFDWQFGIITYVYLFLFLVGAFFTRRKTV